MRDERRIYISQDEKGSSNGFGHFGAWIFGGVMTIALIDRALTMAWAAVSGSWDSFM